MNTRATSMAIIVAATLLQGCAAAVVGGVAATAAVAYDRRTTGTMVDDQSIEVDIMNFVNNDPDLSGTVHVNAISMNNIVLLTGEAPAESLRAKVISAANQTRKVRRVQNEITIGAPTSLGTRSNDTWITSKVKTNLIGDDSVEAGRIKVVTAKGSVYLMGLVTRQEAAAAAEVARTVSGVQRVVKVFEYID